MTTSLVIDACSASGSVAVIRDGRVAAEGEAVMRSGDREFLLPAVQAALAQAGARVEALDAIICGNGPGSFTSLRIAASLAKGIAHARGIQLMTVPSLALIVAERSRAAGRYVAALNALRGEHYASVATVTGDGRVEAEDGFVLVASDELDEFARAHHATLLGASAGEPAQPHARGAARLAARAVDLVTWEPLYGRLAEAQVKWEAAHGRSLHAE